MPHISVVSPVYKGEKMVHELVSRIRENVLTITDDYNIILVNDSSPDNSWKEIVKECTNDKRVKGINLSRNFGQHRAITAGLSYAKGDWVIVMDCDLQDRPEEIPKLYAKAQEGYDIVQAMRVERHDKYLKRLSSTIFYAVYKFMSGIRMDKSIANFGVYRQKVIQAVIEMPEKERGFQILLNYVGFRKIAIPVEHGNRFEGTSSYTLSKLLKLAFSQIISNTNKPLRIMVSLGFVLALVSILIAFYNVLAYLFGFIKVAGFTTTVFSIWFVGSMLMMQLGIVGIYIGKVFDQVKGRPIYLVMDEVNIESSNDGK